MSNCYLSIILPIYNVKDYLERCVNSILTQEFTDYEVIFVDDGSTDGSGELADNLCTRFKEAQVIHKKNGGLSSARNAGLKVANGEYVFMIDSDDWIEKDAFNVICNITSKDLPDILKFNYIRRPDGKSVVSSAIPGSYDTDQIRKVLIPEAVENTGEYVFSAWSHVFKLSFIKNHGLEYVSEREIGSEDYLFNLQAYLKAQSITVISDAIYNYDLREGSLTQRYRKNLYDQYVKLHELMNKAVIDSKLENELGESIAFSFIEKLIGVCMQNECVRSSDHSLFQGWVNAHRMVSNKTYRDMANRYPYYKGRSSRKLLLRLMRMNIVVPTMYLLMR
jgi:glycosyltransferase involved in cell wall biosynthesis